MLLFERMLRQEVEAMSKAGVRISFIGNLVSLPAVLQAEISRAIAMTKNNEGLDLIVALNYGGGMRLSKYVRS